MSDRTKPLRALLSEAFELLEDLKTEHYDAGEGESGYEDRDEVIAWLKAAGSAEGLYDRIKAEALREAARRIADDPTAGFKTDAIDPG